MLRNVPQCRLGWLSGLFAVSKRLDGIVLRELRVRPIRDAAERASWDGLMEAHHCLGFHSPFGTALRPVAELPGGD